MRTENAGAGASGDGASGDGDACVLNISHAECLCRSYAAALVHDCRLITGILRSSPFARGNPV